MKKRNAVPNNSWLVFYRVSDFEKKKVQDFSVEMQIGNKIMLFYSEHTRKITTYLRDKTFSFNHPGKDCIEKELIWVNF
jgi:hypothetical protein